MCCYEFLQPDNAIQILHGSDTKAIQQLFYCIYKSHYQSFLQWILFKFNGVTYKDKLLEDAKDAFQNGVLVFYLKSQKKDFEIKNSLKTTIYNYGLLQLKAAIKKERHVMHAWPYIEYPVTACEIDPDSQQHLVEISKEIELIKAISNLKAKEREVILLKYFNHLRSKQIAEKLHVTVGDIDNTTGKAYKHLRASFTQP